MVDRAANILVVDDDRGIRLILRRALEKDGYEVFEAGDGVQALEIYDREKPDLVLMDCMMPNLDGFSACARIKKINVSAPVLMITGLNDDKSIELAFEAGAVDFISKPINWSVLSQRVSRLLRAGKAEALLDSSKETAKSIFSQSMDGIITIDQYGRIKSFNPAAEQIFGFLAEEMLNQDVRALVPGAYRIEDQCLPEGGLGSPESTAINISRETEGRRKNGTNFPAVVTISGFYSGSRLITIRDITVIKEAEEKLLMAARVFESAKEGIVVFDINETAIQVNSAFTAITGFSPEEVIGKSFSQLKPKPQGEKFYSWARDEFKKNGYWEGELWAKRKNGEAFPMRVSVSPINDKEGKHTHYAFVLSDITERVNLMEEKQRLMEQSMRAQRLASLGTISAGIAHEINQPLNSIKVIVDGMLYWEKKGRFPEKEKVLENLKKISARADRIEDIIKHMRSFVSAGSAARCEPCRINGAVAGALGMIGHQLSSHGINVVKKLGDNLPEIMGNTARLEEVVVNLLVNAMQALDSVSRPEKEITCRTGYEDGKTVLEVSDNATGIDEGIMDRIFDPFFSTKHAGEGMGLGLSIVQSIVTGCGGDIRAFNNAGGGATLRLEFKNTASGEKNRQ